MEEREAWAKKLGREAETIESMRMRERKMYEEEIS